MVVNGREVALDVPANRFLAEVLRYDLGLTGTKIGCNEAECGACTVIVDGAPVLSCVYPALKANRRRVETIEGLAHPAGECQGGHACQQIPAPGAEGLHLHPLQAAFVAHCASQCGFCTPGFIMTAKALLDRNPNPTEAEIRHALKDTYCRCGAYVEIIHAIRSAARQMVEGYRLKVEGHEPQTCNLQPATCNLPAVAEPLTVVGRPVPRPDAVAKATGRAQYTDDLSFPGMLHGATKRAGIPHARILRIDTSRAKALPGVHTVLTHADVPGTRNHGLVIPDWPVLCYDKVRYVGDAVAVVAADTRAIARQACDLIEVEYEPLPVVDSPEAALKPDAPRVHDSGNLLKHIQVRQGDVEQGFAEANLIVERTYRTPSYEHAFMEPECAVGRVADDGRIEVYVGSQIAYADRRQIAAALGVPEAQVRVIGQMIGGGFGGKEDIAGQIHVALLARATGRPVKILYDRHESLLVHPKRHATVIRVKTGAKRDGRLVAVEAELLGDTGAYASLGEKVMTRATTHAAGPYQVPHVKIDCYAMYTNNPPAGAFRGFGVTQSCFAVESNMDILAEELGIDPFELRRVNALRVGGVTSTGQVLRQSVGLLETIERVAEEVRKSGDQEGNDVLPVELRCLAYSSAAPYNPATRRRAWGLACAYKNTGLGGGAPDKAGAEVEVFEDGTAEVRSSSAEVGQGLVSVVAMCTAEELGIPFERVRVLLSDTDRTPDGGPTTASRQTYVTGNAVRLAARQVREVLARAACEELGVPPDRLVFRDGYIFDAGSNPDLRGLPRPRRSLSLAYAVRLAKREGRETRIRYEYQAPQTTPLGQPGDMHFAFSFATQAALVEVDTETGEVIVLKIVGAFDVGRAVNLLGLVGQMEGGAIMGIGTALTEEYLCEGGMPITQTLSRYKMPGIRHTPRFTHFIVEHPTADGPYGAKGIGEISSIPTAPAIANAIYHAVGVRVYRLPVDQDKLLRAIKTGQTEIR
jgi:xanthine dehydrogenase molybdenum-binding subunit